MDDLLSFYFELNPINFIAVFDGHGGKAVSKYLKENLPQFFVNKFNKDIYSKPETATKYFLKVYDLIQNKMKEDHPRAIQYCGSTACVGINFKDLSLSRAFGDLECTPYVTHLPQIYRYKLSSSDKFVIFACDGLWDVMTNQDAVDLVNDLLMNKKFKGNYAKELAETAYKKGSLDNITAVVYLLN